MPAPGSPIFAQRLKVLPVQQRETCAKAHGSYANNAADNKVNDKDNNPTYDNRY
jgi:hypothetical protein